MHQPRSISAQDFASDCPVPLDLVARLSRAAPEELGDLLEGIPEVTRARLAVWLYGRSHTHEIGVRIAATCEGATLRRAASLLGNVLYEVSRQPYVAPSHGARPNTARRVSLGGSYGAARAVA